MTKSEQHRARLLIEAAAEIDPDTYVPVLDALDAGSEDLEDDEREPEEPEGGDELQPNGIWGISVVERCPCCGNKIGTEYWTS